MVPRLNSRCCGLLEFDEESGRMNFFHRTVRDFLRTREMTDLLAEMTPSDFNTALCLLKAWTAAIKSTKFSEDCIKIFSGECNESGLKSLSSMALEYAAEIADGTSNPVVESYKVLDELERCLPLKQKQDRVFLKVSAISLFKETLIDEQLQKYLHGQFSAQADYLSAFGARLVPLLLYSNGKIRSKMREKGMAMLRCALEVGKMDLNKIMKPEKVETRWTHMVCVLCSPESPELKPTWDLLQPMLFSLLFQHGADPNALVYCGMAHQAKFPSLSPSGFLYLHLALNLPLRLSREYLTIFDQFLTAGADLDAIPHMRFCEGKLIPLGRKSNTTGFGSFFSKLTTFGTAHYPRADMILELTNGLLSKAYQDDLSWPMDCIWQIIEKGFSPEHFRQLQSKHLDIDIEGVKAVDELQQEEVQRYFRPDG